VAGKFREWRADGGVEMGVSEAIGVQRMAEIWGVRYGIVVIV
jgi:hypothetical protein